LFEKGFAGFLRYRSSRLETQKHNFEMKMDKNEKHLPIAVVTAGASGIGLATARVLIERGWQVVISDTNAQANQKMATEVGAKSVPFDVTDEVATEATFVEIESSYGPVAALFANVDVIQSGGRVADFPLAEIDRVIATNLRAVYVSCLAAARRIESHDIWGRARCKVILG